MTFPILHPTSFEPAESLWHSSWKESQWEKQHDEWVRYWIGEYRHDGWFQLTRDLPPDILCSSIWQPGYSDECPSNIEDIPPELQIIFKSEGIGDNHVHWGAAFFYEHLLERHRTASETRVFFEQWLNKGDIESMYCDSWVKLYNSYHFNPVPTFLFHGLLAGLIDRFIEGTEPECLGNISKARRLYEDIFSQSFISPGKSIPPFDTWFAGMHRVLDYWDDIDDKRWMYAHRNKSMESFEIPKLLSNASFLAKLFSFLELSSPAEERMDAYNYLFDRMLSIRCLLYSHITQSPGNPGLPEFQKWFNRMRRIRQLINPPISLREKVDTLSRDGSLRHLEFRIDCDIKVYDLLREYGHWRRWPEIERDFQRQIGSFAYTSASSLSLPVLPAKKEKKQENRNPRHVIKRIGFSLGLSKDPQEKSPHIVRFASLLNRYRKSIDEFFKPLYHTKIYRLVLQYSSLSAVWMYIMMNARFPIGCLPLYINISICVAKSIH
jgi:hypothetical protein